MFFIVNVEEFLLLCNYFCFEELGSFYMSYEHGYALEWFDSTSS